MKLQQILINTFLKEELDEILDALLAKKLIACADISPVHSRYCWKAKIADEQRFQAVAYTLADKKDEVIKVVEEMHSDDIPGIIVTPVEANKKYEDWVKESLE